MQEHRTRNILIMCPFTNFVFFGTVHKRRPHSGEKGLSSADFFGQGERGY